LTLRRKHGGWLQTGDVGYFDGNGNLFVVDRLDSMLIVGGENVYPAEVEKLATLLPNAAQVLLAGVDHPIWGKELVLVYKADSDAQPSIALWHRILADQLSAAKIPQRYVSVRDLGLIDFPRKENGKLDRQTVALLVSTRLPGIKQVSG
jgi:acyl-CoA synthetase (AMP-forming)/AMP-acid ligase II